MQLPPPKLDTSDKVIRFGCGAIFGAIGSFYFLRWHVFHKPGIALVDILLFSAIFGWLALKMGDRFWESFRE